MTSLYDITYMEPRKAKLIETERKNGGFPGAWA